MSELALALRIPRLRRRRRPPRWVLLAVLMYLLYLGWLGLCVIGLARGQYLWIPLGLIWTYRTVQMYRALQKIKRYLDDDWQLPSIMSRRTEAYCWLELAIGAAVLLICGIGLL